MKQYIPSLLTNIRSKYDQPSNMIIKWFDDINPSFQGYGKADRSIHQNQATVHLQRIEHSITRSQKSVGVVDSGFRNPRQHRSSEWSFGTHLGVCTISFPAFPFTTTELTY